MIAEGHAARIIDLYERHARSYDRDRGRSLNERAWLDRFLEGVPDGGTVLDLGCGMGEPIARYVIGTGRLVTGVDSSSAMIAMCRARFPQGEWIVVDMREVDLGRGVDGILAWDSLFHLTRDDQRAMFAVFRAHATPGTRLMFTSGDRDDEIVGQYQGEPLYHASLAPDEYEALLASHGFRIDAHVVNDRDCGGHTIWLSTFTGEPSP